MLLSRHHLRRTTANTQLSRRLCPDMFKDWPLLKPRWEGQTKFERLYEVRARARTQR